jgi:hypothetical protein
MLIFIGGKGGLFLTGAKIEETIRIPNREKFKRMIQWLFFIWKRCTSLEQPEKKIIYPPKKGAADGPRTFAFKILSIKIKIRQLDNRLISRIALRISAGADEPGNRIN